MPTADDVAQLQAAVAQLAADTATDAQTLAAAQAQVVALQAQVADLEGQLSAVPTAAAPLVLHEDFTNGLGLWNVRNNTTQNNQYGINLAANVTIQADGLHITAKRQSGLSKPYSTGYLDTIGKHSQSTGRWELVAKLPTFKGAWPAFWLRCDSTGGEIDILETVGGLPGTVVQTVHQDTSGSGDKSGYECKPPGFDPTAWHVYALERDADGTLRWYLDGALTRQAKPTDTDNQGKPMTWLNGPTFASPLNMRLNLQVGGVMPKWYGLDVGSTSALPGDMVVRSVRAYRY